MAEKNKSQLPIGLFSKMTRLSVKALRLYDAKGLLRPAYVDPSSGYRYYQPEQAYAAEIIRTLRSIEMPLQDIKQIVDAENSEVLRERLQLYQARLADELKAQENAIAQLEFMIRNKEVVRNYEVSLTKEPLQQIAAVKIHTSLHEIARDIQAGFVTLVQGLGQVGVQPAAAPMILYHNVIDQECEGDIEIAVPVGTSFPNIGDVYVRQLEAGSMVSTIHRGPYTGLPQAYRALTNWVSENGYDIVGPTREIYVNDPQVVAAEDLITRIEFPICDVNQRVQ